MTDKLDTAAIRTGYATLLDALISEDLDDAARTIVTLCDVWDDLRAENERLRGDRDEGAKDSCNLSDQRDALWVENQRLRAALRNMTDFALGKMDDPSRADEMRLFIDARVALAQKGGE